MNELFRYKPVLYLKLILDYDEMFNFPLPTWLINLSVLLNNLFCTVI